MVESQLGSYVYDNQKRQWINIRTGAPLTAEAVIAELRIHQEAARQMLTALTEQLYAGQITLEQWQIAVASVLKDMHLAQAAFGAGGKANLDAAALGRVNDTLEKQYTFLRDFALAILAGLSLALALNRVLMYGSATQQSFWQAMANSRGRGVSITWTLGIAEHCPDCVALANNSPYTPETLPTYPGAGDTECLTNCKCGLEFS